jgi:hypothetical protein
VPPPWTAQQHRGEIIETVRVLVRIAAADLIAGLLNRNRLTTGHGNRWIRERVTSLRSRSIDGRLATRFVDPLIPPS